MAMVRNHQIFYKYWRARYEFGEWFFAMWEYLQDLVVSFVLCTHWHVSLKVTALRSKFWELIVSQQLFEAALLKIAAMPNDSLSCEWTTKLALVAQGAGTLDSPPKSSWCQLAWVQFWFQPGSTLEKSTFFLLSFWKCSQAGQRECARENGMGGGKMDDCLTNSEVGLTSPIHDQCLKWNWLILILWYSQVDLRGWVAQMWKLHKEGEHTGEATSVGARYQG